MEKYSWSLDVSTTNVGSSLWDSNGKLIELKHLELNIDKDTPIENRDIVKADHFKNYAFSYKERIEKEYDGKIINVIIEEPLPNTSININTTSLLLGFNGMVRFVLYEVFGVPPIKITVHQSRKLFCPELTHLTKRKGETVVVLSFPDEYRDKKKQYIWEKVCKLEPQIEWFYKKDGSPKDACFDMSDSYAVGYAGLKLLEIIK